MIGLSEQTPFKSYTLDGDDKPYDPSQHTAPSLSKCFEMDEGGKSCRRNKATCKSMWVDEGY